MHTSKISRVDLQLHHISVPPLGWGHAQHLGRLRLKENFRACCAPCSPRITCASEGFGERARSGRQTSTPAGKFNSVVSNQTFPKSTFGAHQGVLAAERYPWGIQHAFIPWISRAYFLAMHFDNLGISLQTEAEGGNFVQKAQKKNVHPIVQVRWIDNTGGGTPPGSYHL